jgi:hypothetical protein
MALNYKDMVGMMKPTIHVDEFASKMGDDEDIIVASFFVRSRQAAEDLVSWFEKGYDWVLDADRSPGEIRPGRYLVYIEMRRKNSVARDLAQALSDLTTLTEHKADGWTMHYQDENHPFTRETFEALVPMTPLQYRRRREEDLNEMRTAAGQPTRDIHERTAQVRTLQSAAGII